jgi:hypothetical protein
MNCRPDLSTLGMMVPREVCMFGIDLFVSTTVVCAASEDCQQHLCICSKSTLQQSFISRKQNRSKVYPICCHEGTERGIESRLCCFSLTSALGGGLWLPSRPNHFTST